MIQAFAPVFRTEDQQEVVAADVTDEVAAGIDAFVQALALLSLSIGVVHLRAEACGELDASQLAELASQAKHHAKEILGGSVYLVDGLAEREDVVGLGLSV